MSRLVLAAAMALAMGDAHGASLEVQALDAAGKPVADAAVYATSPGRAPEARGARASIEQRDREFVPYVSVIQQGTAVAFPNRDPILHHIYSFSPAKTFEIKLYTGKSPREVVFDKPGVVTLGCNIHDWMIGYVVVVPTPYFARTDAAGYARLRDLPAGAYALNAWHPQQLSQVAPQAVTLDSATNASTAIVFDLAPRKPRFKPPFDRLKY
jgi:plastocyanin